MLKSSKKALDERVEALIQSIDSGNAIRDEGMENIVHLEGYHLLPEGLDHSEYYLAELQYFAKSLVDAAVRTHTNVITSDFYSYWGWAAAIVSSLSSEPVISRYDNIIEDFYHLVHATLLTERQNRLQSVDFGTAEQIAFLNPSVSGIAMGRGLPLAATFGFSVLDGLLKRRCSQLDLDSEISLHNALLKVFASEPDISHVVRRVLGELDDLRRYPEDALKRKMAGIPNLSGTSSFFWLMKEQRNYNIHGEGSTQAIGSVVLTLITLVLLDGINKSDYLSAQQRVKRMAKQGQIFGLGSHPFSPTSFYPIERF